MSQIGDLKRPGAERTVVLAVLGLFAVLCWACLLLRIGRLAPLGAAAGKAAPVPYHAADLARMFALWVVVTAAMMLPAAAPSVLLYARISANGATAGSIPPSLRSAPATCSSGALGPPPPP